MSSAIPLLASRVIAARTPQTACGRVWQVFKTQFKKVFTVEEEEDRFNAFVSNLKLADMRNADETKGAEHGVTKFMDLTPQEFKARYLGYSKANLPEGKHVVESHPPLTSGAIKDWTGNYTTPVKNQGHCGSCWAFSAVEQVEKDAIRAGLGIHELSTQQVISCDKKDGGCGGGNTETAYEYITKAGGLVSASDYPDVSHESGSTGKCSEEKASNPVIAVKSYHTINDGKDTESAMAGYVTTSGPLSICVDANKWQTYKGGIMTNCPKQLDHCVQAVGINTDASTPYWKVSARQSPHPPPLPLALVVALSPLPSILHPVTPPPTDCPTPRCATLGTSTGARRASSASSTAATSAASPMTRRTSRSTRPERPWCTRHGGYPLGQRLAAPPRKRRARPAMYLLGICCAPPYPMFEAWASRSEPPTVCTTCRVWAPWTVGRVERAHSALSFGGADLTVVPPAPRTRVMPGVSSTPSIDR